MASKDRPKIDARTLAELETIVDRTTKELQNPAEQEILRSAVKTLAFLTSEIESKGVSIRRLRKMLFGSGTEKTDRVLGDSTCGSSTPQTAEPGDASSEDDSAKKSKKKKNRKKYHLY